MKQSVRLEDLQPYSASGYAWRWQDTRHAILPSEALEAIGTLRAEAARRIFPRCLELDTWAREAPSSADTQSRPLMDASKPAIK